MIQNIIFDFGRVIVDFDETKMTRAYVKEESDVFPVRDAVFDRLYWDVLDLGNITDEEIKTALRARLPERLLPSAFAVYDGWIGHIDVIPHIEEAVRTAKELFDGVYLLSNISTQFAERYHRYPEISRILSLFDGLVFSGPLHLVKPDRRIFEHLLSTYRLTADECLFIDDSKKNIEGAAALGIQGYLFDGDARALCSFLKDLRKSQ